MPVQVPAWFLVMTIGGIYSMCTSTELAAGAFRLNSTLESDLTTCERVIGSGAEESRSLLRTSWHSESASPIVVTDTTIHIMRHRRPNIDYLHEFEWVREHCPTGLTSEILGQTMRASVSINTNSFPDDSAIGTSAAPLGEAFSPLRQIPAGDVKLDLRIQSKPNVRSLWLPLSLGLGMLIRLRCRRQSFARSPTSCRCGQLATRYTKPMMICTKCLS